MSRHGLIHTVNQRKNSTNCWMIESGRTTSINSQHSGMIRTRHYPASSKVTDRLFFAIFPDGATAERIASLTQQLCDEHGMPQRMLSKHRLHITVYYIGDYAGLPLDVFEMAREAADKVVLPPFRVSFDLITSFRGKRGNHPIILRSKEESTSLNELQRALATRLERSTSRTQAAPRGFKSHLTLYYGPKRFTRDIDPIGWSVREFVLVHSLIGRGKYVPLARWSLR